jgi:hypothetical protein
VVALLSASAGASAVAAAASAASRAGLETAQRDASVAESILLLAQLPSAANEKDFVAALRRQGVAVEGAPSLLALTAAVTETLDRRLKSSRTDLGEMAGLAAVETVASIVGACVPSLFEATPEDVRAALRSLSTERQFGMLARAFFARFAERYLTYYLSRELSVHVGRGERFETLDDHSAFSAALRLHCYQAARIVEDFAGQWYSKARWARDVSLERARRFAARALEKLGAELARRDSYVESA